MFSIPFSAMPLMPVTYSLLAALLTLAVPAAALPSSSSCESASNCSACVAESCLWGDESTSCLSIDSVYSTCTGVPVLAQSGCPVTSSYTSSTSTTTAQASTTRHSLGFITTSSANHAIRSSNSSDHLLPFNVYLSCTDVAVSRFSQSPRNDSTTQLNQHHTGDTDYTVDRVSELLD
jgi:hypothetical protein